MKNSFFLVFLLCVACAPKTENKDRIELPSKVEETSGLASVGEDLLTHNDSGDQAILYQINTQGALVNTHEIKGAIHRDWEDIAQDENHYYVADIGNNNGKRKDLTIYILSHDFILQDSIRIAYSKQTSFKKKKKTKYDAESLISYGDSLLVFSKNRKSKSTQLYAFPKTPGTYKLSSLKKFKVNTLITGGDYDATSKLLVLTGYLPDYTQYLLKAKPFGLDILDQVVIEKHQLPLENAQVEGVKIIDSTQVWISSEGEGHHIPFLQKLTLDQLTTPVTIADKKQ